MREPERLGERQTGPGIGRAVKLEDSRGRYVAFVKNTFPRDLTLDGVRVVVDAAHGAAYVVAPLVFSELGRAASTPIGVRPNGTNINREAGALHPEHALRRGGAARGPDRHRPRRRRRPRDRDRREGRRSWTATR